MDISTRFEQLFRALTKNFSEAGKAIGEIEDLIFPRPHEDEDLVDAKIDGLVHLCELIAQQLKIAYSIIGLKEISEEVNKLMAEGDPKALKQIDFSYYVYSPRLESLRLHYSALSGLFPAETANERTEVLRERLTSILNGIGKVMLKRGIVPTKEAQVREVAMDIVVHVFPDALSDPHISKVAKTFKPDIGIPSLKTAIEFKFVTSEHEFKVAIEGVYADSCGYSESENWEYFVAVFYCTENFITQEQLALAMNSSKNPVSWIPIFVCGRGQRGGSSRAKIAARKRVPSRVKRRTRT